LLLRTALFWRTGCRLLRQLNKTDLFAHLRAGRSWRRRRGLWWWYGCFHLDGSG
jgi:hypothetical protein